VHLHATSAGGSARRPRERNALTGWAVSPAGCSALLPASELIIAGCSALPVLLETADEVMNAFML